MRTAEQLTRRLELAHRWYRGMIGDTGRFEYIYVPGRDAFVRDGSPIRDIASVWDAAVLEAFLGKNELRPVIETSLRHYLAGLTARNTHLIVDPERIHEPSSIAHSAFMILALLHAPPPRDDRRIAALADGILAQQRTDGSYKVYFHDLPDHGEELYAGEAMLALLETHRALQEERYLDSAERAFHHYDAFYFGLDRVTDDVLVFFANWQSQACRLLFDRTRGDALRQQAADYVYRMHDRILEQCFYDDVRRHPRRQVSVQVACALEGLNDAYAVALQASDRRVDTYRKCLCTGLDYLLALQCSDGGTQTERGGFGMSLDERTQRIDVTGHAASAFMKSVQNRLECSPPPIREASRPGVLL